MSVPAVRPTSSASAGFPGWLAATLLVLVTLVAYHNSFSGPFVFDDTPAIAENASIRRLWPLSEVLFPQQAGGLTTSGRPVVNLSFALNHAISGPQVWSYHVANLGIHGCAGLCLFGVVRRTLLTPGLRARFGPAAVPLAATVAALWLLHPLQTAAVTYVVQRAESLAGLFYLLTLYAFMRAESSSHGGRWRALSVGACLLGMATKEIVVTAPLVVLLYDRTFVAGSFAAAWRQRRVFYGALAATWLVLAVLVLTTGGRGGTAGFGTAVSPWSYALTQCTAIVRYVRLAFWPDALVFDYGTGTVGGLKEVLVEGFTVVALFATALIALGRRPVLGFIGVVFFLLLAPSSSIVPVATQTMAEHRMYLPLAAVAVLTGVGLHTWCGRWGVRIAAGLAIALSLVTVRRNHDYRSELVLWGDTAAKWPQSARAHNNYGQALFRAGDIPASIRRYENAVRLQPDYPESHYNLGVAFAALGQLPAAIERYETALRLQPDYPEAHNNLGNALLRVNRMAEALRHYDEALRRRPDFAEAHNNLGNALLQEGRARESQAHFQRALQHRPRYHEARYNLGNALAQDGRMPEALEQYLEAIRIEPKYGEAWVNAGNALLALDRPLEAVKHYERAVALLPQSADAQFNLGSAFLQLERWGEAIGALEAVLRVDPEFVRAHRALGFALAQSGRAGEAQSHYDRYLRAVPEDAEAKAELAQIRAVRR